MSRFLIAIGVLLIILGLILPYLSKLGLGRLPGDIYIERENYSFYFPIATSVLISLAVSLVFWLISRFHK